MHTGVASSDTHHGLQGQGLYVSELLLSPRASHTRVSLALAKCAPYIPGTLLGAARKQGLL